MVCCSAGLVGRLLAGGLVAPGWLFFPMNYTPKTKPFEHQRELFERTRDLEAHALFWEPGVGKTKPTIDTIGHLFAEGKINGALVLAPKAVAPNWMLDELPLHLGCEATTFLWDTAKAGNKGYQEALDVFLDTPRDQLAVLVMSYDAIMTERKKGAARGLKKGLEAAQAMLKERDSIMVLDESARIKNPDSKRTKRVTAAGKHAKFRRILTGTPVVNSPFDVFAQLRFLDPEVWASIGCSSFASFKAHFGVWMEHTRNDNGQSFKTLIDYQNMTQLAKFVDQLGSRLLKTSVLDLPPKMYEKRTFTMTAEQKRLYEKMRKEFIIWLDSDMVTAPLAITRMLRLQQITSGFCPTDDGNTIVIEPNPRIACVLEAIEDLQHQCIIWCKYQKTIDLIAAALTKAGKTNVVYDGRVNQTDRETRREAFKAGEAQFFVANPAAAGEGLTLHMAKTVVYAENSYKLGDRLQSEDRAHRAGMDDNPVLYIDVVAEATIDAVILRALRNKVDLANQITGDKIKTWI